MREINKSYSPAVQTAMTLLRSRTNVSRMIVEYRMKLGLSQVEVARRAGTKQSRVSELETLAGNVVFDTLDRVALALGLEITLQPRADVAQEPITQSASTLVERTYSTGAAMFFTTPIQGVASAGYLAGV